MAVDAGEVGADAADRSAREAHLGAGEVVAGEGRAAGRQAAAGRLDPLGPLPGDPHQDVDQVDAASEHHRVALHRAAPDPVDTADPRGTPPEAGQYQAGRASPRRAEIHQQDGIQHIQAAVFREARAADQN